MMESGKDGKMRCFGNRPGQEFYAEYHDNEWGIPIHDDRKLFEMLVLEGVQAGLSWVTVLKKRAAYRDAFYQFDVRKVAAMTDDELEALRQNEKIIRNRLKIFAARKNALAFIETQKKFGSFATYLWGYVDHKPIVNDWHSIENRPATTKVSDAIAKDLKMRGMSFVGSTIIYAYMQAVGMVDDHVQGCCCYERNRRHLLKQP